MKKNTKVSWRVDFGNSPTKPFYIGRGTGVLISDESDGRVLVAVDTMAGEPFPGYHSVIYCTVTWLTVEQ